MAAVAFDSSVYDAAGRGNLDELKSAIAAHPELIDASNPLEENKTPFHNAASNGHSEVVKALVEQGSKAIDTPDNDGWAPMHRAANDGFVEVVQALADAGSKSLNAASDGWTPTFLAAANGHEKVIEKIAELSSQRDIDVADLEGRTPLLAAVEGGHLAAVEVLLKLGSEAVNSRDHSDKGPIHVAASLGFNEILLLLVNHNVSCSNASSDLGGGDLPSCPVLDLDLPNETACTAMHLAAAAGHHTTVQLLHDSGSKALNSHDQIGATPLYFAAMFGHMDCIGVLAGLGAKIDEANDEGETPLYVAAQYGHAVVIDQLVRLGSQAVNTATNYGSTPIQIAAQSPCPEFVVDTLRRAGA